MQYPRETHLEEPFDYHGYTVQISTFEAEPGDWRGAYRIFRGAVQLHGASVATPFDARSDALENTDRIARGAVDALVG